MPRFNLLQIDLPPFVTLTDGATITWDATANPSATVTLGGNRTLALSNLVNGASGALIVRQDATGGRTLALPSGSRVVGTGAATVALSTAPNSRDLLTFVSDGTEIYWQVGSYGA